MSQNILIACVIQPISQNRQKQTDSIYNHANRQKRQILTFEINDSANVLNKSKLSQLNLLIFSSQFIIPTLVKMFFFCFKHHGVASMSTSAGLHHIRETAPEIMTACLNLHVLFHYWLLVF